MQFYSNRKNLAAARDVWVSDSGPPPPKKSPNPGFATGRSNIKVYYTWKCDSDEEIYGELKILQNNECELENRS